MFAVNKVHLASIGFVLLAAMGCTKSNPGFQLVGDNNGIFSTRPQSATHTVVMIKLADAPLAQSLITENGKKIVDPEKAEALDAAQNKLIAALDEISQDIKVLYRYRLIVNGITVVAPVEYVSRIRKIANVIQVELSLDLERPKNILPMQTAVAQAVAGFEKNSVKFIGGDLAHNAGFRGEGIKVGIIDTGIDYTHAMFGGAGTEEAYKAIDPSKETSAFPTPKVVGGIDLAGTDYNTGSPDFMKRIPVPDSNPIDEQGHGTHVAGTVAGIGDGVNTYDGVAPFASLYAIKVFGAAGSTSDSVVIAGLEYALDPNTDGDLADQLDVVNLSLGGGYGEPHLIYTEAVRNLSQSGTVVVASGGNSGDLSYIVGAPGSADDAFSVAASIDDMDSNWRFRAVYFHLLNEPGFHEMAVEGTVGKPIAEAGVVSGTLVYVGLADKDFNDEEKAKLNGKVAFIDRGGVSFEEKVKRAVDAGAIGVVVANNAPGNPIAMGGEKPANIPAIMVTLETGDRLKKAMKSGITVIDFQTDHLIDKPELIDSITDFSSRGPRSQDALIKPEIAAPGQNIVSAEMGKGNKGVALSGTSMAGPHIAGVMALMKQKHPTLSSAHLKAMVMATAKTLVDPKKVVYPVSRQGAGRVQIMEALSAPIAPTPQGISLGEVTVEGKKTMLREVTFENVSGAAVTADVSFEGPRNLKLLSAPTVTIEAGKEFLFDLRFSIDAAGLSKGSNELGGWIFLKVEGKEIARVPVLAIANKVAQVQVEKLVVHSTSKVDSQGAWVEATLKNPGLNSGDAYLFNFLGRDDRKGDTNQDAYRSRACDLSESGYRTIKRDGKEILQVAVKLYEPMTTWDNCEVAVLIDGDGDGVADQELVGAKQDHLPGLTANEFASILLDAKRTRELRKKFEIEAKDSKPEDKIVEDYKEALLALERMSAFEHSTIAIVEAPVEALKLRPSGELSVRIATSYQELSAIEADDFLADNAKKWMSLNVRKQGAAFDRLPESTTVPAGESVTLNLVKGAGLEPLWAIFPQNAAITGGLAHDRQSQIPRVIYSESADEL